MADELETLRLRVEHLEKQRKSMMRALIAIILRVPGGFVRITNAEIETLDNDASITVHVERGATVLEAKP